MATPLAFHCPRCLTVSEMQLFPVLQRGPLVGRSSAASSGDEATCFFHEEKRADAACDHCGRFICVVCDLHVGNRHLCPACFGEGGRNAGEPAAHTIRFRLLPARLGLWIALFSLVIWPIGIIGGPAAIYLGVRGLRQAGSITGRRTTLAAITAIILGLVEVTVWIFLVAAMIIALSGTRS